jgi:hypothetical protein
MKKSFLLFGILGLTAVGTFVSAQEKKPGLSRRLHPRGRGEPPTGSSPEPRISKAVPRC